MPNRAKATDTGKEAYLQLLIDAVVDYAIYMLSVDGRVLSWNTGAARLKGYQADEIIGCYGRMKERSPGRIR